MSIHVHVRVHSPMYSFSCTCIADLISAWGLSLLSSAASKLYFGPLKLLKTFTDV